jgi:hypothetical protein
MSKTSIKLDAADNAWLQIVIEEAIQETLGPNLTDENCKRNMTDKVSCLERILEDLKKN